MIVTDIQALRVVCEPVKNIQEGIEVAKQLNSFLDRFNKKAKKKARDIRVLKGLEPNPVVALGVAAPQLGIRKRVCVVDIMGMRSVMMNPVIVAHSGVKIPFPEEGCLSLPGIQVTTYRWLWITVKTLNRGIVHYGAKGFHEQHGRFALLKSVVAQHEISHLSGLLVTDFAKEAYPEPSEWDGWNANDNNLGSM